MFSGKNRDNAKAFSRAKVSQARNKDIWNGIFLFFFIEPYFNLIDMLVSLVSLKNGWQNVHFGVTYELKKVLDVKNQQENRCFSFICVPCKQDITIQLHS